MLNTIKGPSLTLALALGAIALAPQTSALASSEKTYDVRYHPTELSSPADAEAVLLRIHTTANELCRDEFGPERHSKKLQVQRCLREVTQELVDGVSHEYLNQAHAKVRAPRKINMYTKIKTKTYVVNKND